MTGQYYPDKIDIRKDAFSIPGISMAYVLNKSLKKSKQLGLYSLGGICYDGYCEECQLDLQAIEKCGCERQPLMSC